MRHARATTTSYARNHGRSNAAAAATGSSPTYHPPAQARCTAAKISDQSAAATAISHMPPGGQIGEQMDRGQVEVEHLCVPEAAVLDRVARQHRRVGRVSRGVSAALVP